jgi:hypothetical protein
MAGELDMLNPEMLTASAPLWTSRPPSASCYTTGHRRSPAPPSASSAREPLPAGHRPDVCDSSNPECPRGRENAPGYRDCKQCCHPKGPTCQQPIEGLVDDEMQSRWMLDGLRVVGTTDANEW